MTFGNDVWHQVPVVTEQDRESQFLAISSFDAALCSIAFILLYVVPFYLSAKTRPSPSLNRDAPRVIQARIRSVTCTVIATSVVTFVLLTTTTHCSTTDALHQLGLWPISLWSTLRPLLLTFTLYLAPLYKDIVLDQSVFPISDMPQELFTSLSSSIGFRNYIAGPVTEELLFRSSLIPVHLLSPMSRSGKQLVFLTPLYFAIAHVHHFYEFRLTHPHTAMTPALLRTIFQFMYTTIFGWYAAYVFLRTGNVYTVVLIHAFCNYMGLPQLFGKITLHSRARHAYKPAPQDGRAVYNEKHNKTHSQIVTQGSGGFPRLVSSLAASELFQTMIYYGLLGLGLFLFARHLVSWTDFPGAALVSFNAV